MLWWREGKEGEGEEVEMKEGLERIKEERMRDRAPCIVWLNTHSLKFPAQSVKITEEEFQVQMEVEESSLERGREEEEGRRGGRRERME